MLLDLIINNDICQLHIVIIKLTSSKYTGHTKYLKFMKDLYAVVAYLHRSSGQIQGHRSKNGRTSPLRQCKTSSSNNYGSI